MSENNAAVRQRTQNADYLLIDGTYEFAGTGFTKLDDSPTASTKKKRYINMKSESTNISGYGWVSAFSFDQIDSEKVIAYLVRVGKEELIGADTETDYVSVDLLGTKDIPGEDGEGSRGYPARRRRVAVEVASFADSDGEIEGTGNLLAKSDWIFGWFDVEKKTFVQDEMAKSNFAYAKTLASEPL